MVWKKTPHQEENVGQVYGKHVFHLIMDKGDISSYNNSWYVLFVVKGERYGNREAER